MSKKQRSVSRKTDKKKQLLDIELKLKNSFPDLRKDLSDKKISRKLKKAGKILKTVLAPAAKAPKEKKVVKTSKKTVLAPVPASAN